MRTTGLYFGVLILCLLWEGPAITAQQISEGITTPKKVNPRIWQTAQEEGIVRVIVDRHMTTQAEKGLTAQSIMAQRQEIGLAQSALLNEMRGRNFRVTGQLITVPTIGLEVEPYVLNILETSTRVKKVTVDYVLDSTLSNVVQIEGATQAWNSGYSGTGWNVAILDTGINKSHPSVANKVVAEACYSDTNDCPFGGSEELGLNTGVPCTWASIGCNHGTTMAWIAAGTGATPGIAKNSGIISIRVFSRFSGPNNCPSPQYQEDPCARVHTIDLQRGLERVLMLSATMNIASANMSLGSAQHFDHESCDASTSEGMMTVISNLRAVGIPTVASSGNDSYVNAMNWPACISKVVSVGAATKTDGIRASSNSAHFLSLLAVGEDINLPTPGSGTLIVSGTSAAAAQVTGAWAILKQKYPTATVAQVLAALQLTALPIKDPRDSDPQKQYIQCRIRIDKALDNFPTNDLITFNHPNGDWLGSYFGINKCQITGDVTDSTWPYNTHGFLLSGIGGQFMTFDAPNSVMTAAPGINNTGHIAAYADIPNQNGSPVRGLVRFPDGTWDSVNPPVSNGGTMVMAINDPAQAAGWWWDGSIPVHGLFKPLAGGLQTFDKPGATQTQFYGINNLGEMVGQYADTDGYPHGLLRRADGTYEEINCPGAVNTTPLGINDAGHIVGAYWDGGDSSPAFIRSPNGTCSIISVPNALYPWPTAINSFGQVVGSAYDEIAGSFGFVFNSLTE